MADKCRFEGETVRHFNAGKPATFELFAPGAKKGDVDVNIISKSLPNLSRVQGGNYREVIWNRQWLSHGS